MLNSVAHNFDFANGTSTSLNNKLESGNCAHEIRGGTVSYSGAVISTTVVRGVLNVDITVASTCTEVGCDKFQCNVRVDYTPSGDFSHLLGGGRINSCDGFNCKLRNRGIKCEDLKKALTENTCSVRTTPIYSAIPAPPTN